MRSSWFVIIVLGFLPFAGCKQKTNDAKAPQSGSKAADKSALPADLFVAEVPAGARSVAEVRADMAAKEVVIQGRVGGRKDPFVKGVAIFVLADAVMKSCDQIHGDDCKTPWDYCCEPTESLLAKIATIQIVDANGKPLRTDIKGQSGVEPLKTVTVAGSIASRDAGSLVINAHKIHVASGGG